MRSRRRSGCAGREPRAPPGDREQGDVDAAREQRHRVEEVGVSGEVDARRPVEQEAQ